MELHRSCSVRTMLVSKVRDIPGLLSHTQNQIIPDSIDFKLLRIGPTFRLQLRNLPAIKVFYMLHQCISFSKSPLAKNKMICDSFLILN